MMLVGTRRHWSVSWLHANNHSEIELIARIETLDDEGAFRLADLEIASARTSPIWSGRAITARGRCLLWRRARAHGRPLGDPANHALQFHPFG
jgi:hypothetical protein